MILSAAAVILASPLRPADEALSEVKLLHKTLTWMRGKSEEERRPHTRCCLCSTPKIFRDKHASMSEQRGWDASKCYYSTITAVGKCCRSDSWDISNARVHRYEMAKLLGSSQQLDGGLCQDNPFFVAGHPPCPGDELTQAQDKFRATEACRELGFLGSFKAPTVEGDGVKELTVAALASDMAGMYAELAEHLRATDVLEQMRTQIDTDREQVKHTNDGTGQIEEGANEEVLMADVMHRIFRSKVLGVLLDELQPFALKVHDEKRFERKLRLIQRACKGENFLEPSFPYLRSQDDPEEPAAPSDLDVPAPVPVQPEHAYPKLTREAGGFVTRAL